MNQKIVVAINDYSLRNGYPAERFASPRCKCGGEIFAIAVDDQVGAAVRTCHACGDRHAVGDSAEYLDGAELETCSCPCGSETFEYIAAAALYSDKQAIRWIYIGLLCSSCKSGAVYADWKNEDNSIEAWIARA